MSDTTAQIAAKGCKSTGITEELADRLHDQLDKKLMCIVELKSSARTERADGKQKVVLEILTVEPAVDQIADDHLRNLQRALFMNRRLHGTDDQPTLDTADDIEPTVTDVITAQQALVHHPLVGDPSGCEVCGNDALHPLHDTTDDDLEEDDYS